MEILSLLYSLLRIREKKEAIKERTKPVLKVHYRKGYELYERTN